MRTALLHADPLPLLAESRALLEIGYTVAAAVVARSALEAYVANACHAIDYRPISKRGGCAAGMIEGLRRLGAIEKVQTSQCLAIWRTGSAAAHGRTVEAVEVARAIEHLTAILAKGVEA